MIGASEDICVLSGMTDCDFDIIVWGATGFTGSLVAEYLLSQYGVDD